MSDQEKQDKIKELAMVINSMVEFFRIIKA